MKIMIFGSRTMKEIIRDPVSLFFGIAFPIIILLLLMLINRNVPNDLFSITNLSPGMQSLVYHLCPCFRPK